MEFLIPDELRAIRDAVRALCAEAWQLNRTLAAIATKKYRLVGVAVTWVSVQAAATVVALVLAATA